MTRDNTRLLDLPAPDEYALEQSRLLTALVHAEIEANGGDIGFDRYMEMALYQPGLGYYSAGARKFGRGGDFTTAPETSPLFSICLARQCAQIFSMTGSARVLELGAGSGVMACDILTELRRLGVLPEQYLILETSADLRQRQQQLLHERHPDLKDRLVWLDGLPDQPVNGVILANEVLDAIPVQRIWINQNRIHELRVSREGDGFVWRQSTHEVSLASVLNDLVDELPDGYISEFNSMLPAFINTLSAALGNGALLLIDYGYQRQEYYHPQRSEGTLACYYRHRRHDNPFINIGIQDITASVDFTLVAESAHKSGLDVYGYSNQSGFLISCGLENILGEISAGDEKRHLRYSQQAGRLLLPGQMGESFKVMSLGKNLNQPLIGISFGSQLHRL